MCPKVPGGLPESPGGGGPFGGHGPFGGGGGLPESPGGGEPEAPGGGGPFGGHGPFGGGHGPFGGGGGVPEAPGGGVPEAPGGGGPFAAVDTVRSVAAVPSVGAAVCLRVLAAAGMVRLAEAVRSAAVAAGPFGGGGGVPESPGGGGGPFGGGGHGPLAAEAAAVRSVAVAAAVRSVAVAAASAAGARRRWRRRRRGTSVVEAAAALRWRWRARWRRSPLVAAHRPDTANTGKISENEEYGWGPLNAFPLDRGVQAASELNSTTIGGAVDTVLGVAMAPSAVRMVLVEGESGDGATVDEDNFAVSPDTGATVAADQVISAILGTREGAAEGGYQLAATGVTWTDPVEAAALRDALAAHKIENVMLVSAFLAAAALAHAVGSQTDYAQTALLFIEPDTATLAVVDTADGSIADIDRQLLPEDDEAAWRCRVR